ncbi:hypothetical protein pipiens_008813, partial [Culex pipiens pipiens]
MCLDVDGLAGCCDLVVIFTLVVDQFVSLVAIIICRALVTVTNRYCWRGGNVSAVLGDSANGMMAPSPSKSTKTQHPSFIITADSVDTSPVPSSPPSTDAPKSQCSSLSDGESFECYGDNDISISENGGVDLELAPTLNSTPNGQNNDNLPNRRWGSMRHSGKRQLGSNALANHLYRSSSFNSSGRSSNCDTAEDMYSDVSLEDVQDLNHK